MNIDNLCKSAPVQCGACHSEQSLVRYLQLEGWVTGKYSCEKCGYKHTVIVSPSLLKKQGNVIRIEQTQCQKCGHDSLIFRHARL